MCFQQAGEGKKVSFLNISTHSVFLNKACFQDKQFYQRLTYMVEEKHKLQRPLAILFHLSGGRGRREVGGTRPRYGSHNPGAWAPQKTEPKSQARIFPLLSTQYHYIINALLTTVAFYPVYHNHLHTKNISYTEW